MASIKPRPPRPSRRATASLLLGYFVTCVAAAFAIEAITGWSTGSTLVIVAIFYVLLVLLGAAVLRPIATIAMLVFRSARQENRRDVSAPRRRWVRRGRSAPPG